MKMEIAVEVGGCEDSCGWLMALWLLGVNEISRF